MKSCGPRYLAVSILLLAAALPAHAQRPSLNQLNAEVNQLQAQVQAQQAQIDQLLAAIDELLGPRDLISAVAMSGPPVEDSVISILHVNVSTGERTVLSGPDGSGGVVGSGPEIRRNADVDVGIAYADGYIWASTAGGGKYIRIDPATGDRTLVSGCPAHGQYVCQEPVVGGGPEVGITWGLSTVPVGE